jgi:hypothetical protein
MRVFMALTSPSAAGRFGLVCTEALPVALEPLCLARIGTCPHAIFSWRVCMRCCWCLHVAN